MKDTVQERIGNSGFLKITVPGGRRKLRRDNRRSLLMTIPDDFKQVVPFLGLQRFESKIIEEKQVESGQRDKSFVISALAARQS